MSTQNKKIRRGFTLQIKRTALKDSPDIFHFKYENKYLGFKTC